MNNISKINISENREHWGKFREKLKALDYFRTGSKGRR